MKNRIDLLGNRHLHAVTARESESGRRGPYAFRNFSMQSGKNLRELAAFAQLDAYCSIA